MFRFLDPPPHTDPQLGVFRRSRGKWRGNLDLGDGSARPLVVVGSRRGPDAGALEIARSLRAVWPGWRPTIERALFEHFEPYAESAGDDDELAAQGIERSRDSTPADLWRHARIEYILVAPLSGSLVVEIGISAAWDEEHTLGARFRNGEFLELNGSVLAP